MAGPYGTSRTWAAGERPSAAQFNAELRDWIIALANPPIAILSRSTNQQLTTATITPISFDTEQVDTDAMHDALSPTRLTLTKSGVYVIEANLSYASNATGFRGAFIYKNGGSYLISDRIASEWRQANNGDVTEMAVGRTYKFTAGEFIELVGYQTSGGNLNVTATGGFSPTLSAAWIGKG